MTNELMLPRSTVQLCLHDCEMQRISQALSSIYWRSVVLAPTPEPAHSTTHGPLR